MLIVVSYLFLDLRFLAVRPARDTPQCEWLTPRWIYRRGGRPRVGRLGLGTPLPGRPLRTRDLNRHACVDGSRALQTPEEAAGARPPPFARFGPAVVRAREYVADEWGHVRFDLTLETATHEGFAPEAAVEAILRATATAPLAGEPEFALGEAGPHLMRVYEQESLKTCIGFVSRHWRNEAVAAAAGSVAESLSDPIVTIVDGEAAGPEGAAFRRTDIQATPMRASFAPGASLVWRLRQADGAGDDDTALEAAFGLNWLTGSFLEFLELPARAADYEARVGALPPARLRSARKSRNRRFSAPEFAGWPCRETLRLAVAAMRDRERRAAAWLGALGVFSRDPRDAGGLGGAAQSILNGAFVMANRVNVVSGPIQGSSIAVDAPFARLEHNTNNEIRSTVAELPELRMLIERLLAELREHAVDAPERREPAEATARALSGVIGMADAAAQSQASTADRRALSGAIAKFKEIALRAFEAAPDVIATVHAIASLIARAHGI